MYNNFFNPLSNEGFVELFFQQPDVITVQHHDEIKSLQQKSLGQLPHHVEGPPEPSEL